MSGEGSAVLARSEQARSNEEAQREAQRGVGDVGLLKPATA
jgi:hypothetical protein